MIDKPGTGSDNDELARLRAEVKTLRERSAIAEAERAELARRIAAGIDEHAELISRMDTLLSRVSVLLSGGGDWTETPPRRRKLWIVPVAATAAIAGQSWHKMAPAGKAAVGLTTAATVTAGAVLLLAPGGGTPYQTSQPRWNRPAAVAPVGAPPSQSRRIVVAPRPRVRERTRTVQSVPAPVIVRVAGSSPAVPPGPGSPGSPPPGPPGGSPPPSPVPNPVPTPTPPPVPVPIPSPPPLCLKLLSVRACL
jgi:hypothetical protein